MLLKAKQQLHHGAWIPWIKTNLSIAPRTAQKYIRVAERWAEIEANATSRSHLGYNEALALIADKGPEGDEPPVLDAANASPVTLLDPPPAEASPASLEIDINENGETLTWADMLRLQPKLGQLQDEAMLMRSADPGYCWEKVWLGPFDHAGRDNAGDPRSFATRIYALVGWYAKEGPPVLRHYWAFDLGIDALAASLPRCPENCPCGCGGVPRGSLLALTLPARNAREAENDLHAARVRQCRDEAAMA
jgi:hypothetical protein